MKFKSIIVLYSLVLVCTMFLSQSARGQDQRSQYKNLSKDEYKVWMKKYFEDLVWLEHEFDRKLTSKVLKKSYILGKSYIINNQKPYINLYQLPFQSTELSKVLSAHCHATLNRCLTFLASVVLP